MHLTIFSANCTGVSGNCSYPNRNEIHSAEEMKRAVSKDHVCAEYRNNYRSIDNFLHSNCLVMDIDNDHTEDPDGWITPARLDELFPDVSFAVAPSRHHMLPKDDKGPRPRLHIYFEIAETSEPAFYAGLKTGLQRKYPFFDDNALDAARFIYGSECGEIVWHEGWETIDEEVEPVYEDEAPKAAGKTGKDPDGRIRQGNRNNTLSHFAGRALKRFGDTDKAKQVFLEEALKCDPPLSNQELKTIWGSALKFFKNKVETSEGYIPPDQYADDFGENSLRPSDYSDVGEAKVFSREYGAELRFSEATDFIRYDGEAWIEERQFAVGAMIEFLDLQLADAMDRVEQAKEALITAGVSKETVAAGGRELERAAAGADQLKLLFALIGAQTYLKFVMKRRDYKYAMNAMNFTKAMVAVGVDDLDKDANLLNTPYATYDLAKGMAGDRAHNPEDLITKLTACSPSDEGKDVWEESLSLFFENNQELIDYVQLVVGMAAVGKVYQEHLIIAYGSGANGKSTFWNTISRVLGTYSGKLSAETLTMNCKRNVKPEMAELKGKRLIIASEMEEGMRLNTSVVKQLCSTDEIFAEKKYKAPFSFTPSHTLVLYTNHLPRVGANDDGIWRRLIVIPFNAKITGTKDIKNYAETLYEKAGGYILKWIIEGAEKAIALQFKTPLPRVVEDAINEYRKDNDWLGHFLEDCCDLDTSYKEKSGEFYQQYRAYCIQNGEYIRSTTDFYSAVEKAGYVKRRTNTGSFIYGLRLKKGQDFLE